MMKKVLLVAAIMTLIICATLSAANVWRVNSSGTITLNGSEFRVKGGSWFGLEGRYEIPSDENNPRGAPMELYMGNVWWQSSNRTYDGDAREIKNMGFNVIRLPLVPQTLDDNDPQGKDPVLKNTQSVRIQGAFTALKTVIKACSDAGLYVLLDIHSCSNYLGWRAGRFDSKPPFADADRNNYDYKREDCSCSASGNPSGVTRIQAYDTQKWLANLKTLAGLGSSIGVDNIIGIDIFNEPWDYTWSEWKSLIDQAYEAINSVNQNILVFAQGIGNKSEFGDGNNPNWGENLYGVRDNPPTMPKERLVFSPHTYGPSVSTQDFFADLNAQPECRDLIEDDFGDAKCQIVINPAVLEPGWEEHFGYLRDMGYAICIGEFGGNKDWPNKAEQRHQTRYSYLTDKTTDWQWQNAFVNYLIKRGITDTIYWSINPESSDTYGIYTTPYDPLNNTGGWGTWQGTDSQKLDMLKKIWNAVRPTIGPTNTPTNTGGGSKGDVDGVGGITILDALKVSQYAVGTPPAGFIAANADVNCDGSINIIDALMIAQRYVGLISNFPC